MWLMWLMWLMCDFNRPKEFANIVFDFPSNQFSRECARSRQ